MAQASSCDNVPGYAPPCPVPGTHQPGTAFTGAEGIPLGFALMTALVLAAIGARWRSRDETVCPLCRGRTGRTLDDDQCPNTLWHGTHSRALRSRPRRS